LLLRRGNACRFAVSASHRSLWWRASRWSTRPGSSRTGLAEAVLFSGWSCKGSHVSFTYACALFVRALLLEASHSCQRTTCRLAEIAFVEEVGGGGASGRSTHRRVCNEQQAFQRTGILDNASCATRGQSECRAAACLPLFCYISK